MSKIIHPITNIPFEEDSDFGREAEVLWEELRNKHPKKGRDWIQQWIRNTPGGHSWTETCIERAASKIAGIPSTLKSAEKDHDDEPAEHTLVREYGEMDPDDQYRLDNDVKSGVSHLDGEFRLLKAACYQRRCINPNAALMAATKVRDQADGIVKRLLLQTACIALAALMLVGCGSNCERQSDAPVTAAPVQSQTAHCIA